jgi:peptidoglycan/xylan/chitin deacetylase (PgdA/CDA1 family)
MRFVSPFMKKVVYPSMAGAGILRRTSATGLAIVTYHGVLPEGYEPIDPGLDGNLISAEALRRQLRLLKQNYNVISPEEMLEWVRGGRELPRRAVLLTCDDGLLNCLTDMAPVLQQEGLRCLFFVTGASTRESRTMLWYEELFLLLIRSAGEHLCFAHDGVTIEGKLGSREERRALWWNSVKRLSQLDATTRESFLSAARSELRDAELFQVDRTSQALCRRFGLMTFSELQQLASMGMTIGAHTLSHPMLSQASLGTARAEMCGCKTALESLLRKPVWALAYPFGDPQSVTPEILNLSREAEFEAAFLNYGGGLGVALPLHALPRIHVTASMSFSEFEAHVSGFYMRLQNRAGRSAQLSGTAEVWS